MARPHAQFQRWQRFGLRRRRFELGEDRLERIEPRRERVSPVIQLLAQISGEGGGLIVGQVEGSPPKDGPLTIRNHIRPGMYIG
jgi:hypothetical protein